MERKYHNTTRGSEDGRRVKPSEVMKFAYREMFDPRVIGFSLIVSAVLLGVLTLVGPIGSYESLSPIQRFVYCTVCAAFCWPVCYSMSIVTFYLTRNRTPRESALAATLAMLIAAVPCTAISASYDALFHADFSAYDEFFSVYVVVAFLATACCLLFLYIVCQRRRHAEMSAPTGAAKGALSGGVSVAYPGERRGADMPDDSKGLVEGHSTTVAKVQNATSTSSQAEVTTATAESQTRFFDRLPLELGRELVYLKTADHYVEVHTTGGSRRVLVRFVDAVAELGPLGIQVHRSYWVAHRQLTELEKRGNRLVMRLAGDHEVPVSRTYLPAVRDSLRAREGVMTGTAERGE